VWGGLAVGDFAHNFKRRDLEGLDNDNGQGQKGHPKKRGIEKGPIGKIQDSRRI